MMFMVLFAIGFEGYEKRLKVSFNIDQLKGNDDETEKGMSIPLPSPLATTMSTPSRFV